MRADVALFVVDLQCFDCFVFASIRQFLAPGRTGSAGATKMTVFPRAQV